MKKTLLIAAAFVCLAACSKEQTESPSASNSNIDENAGFVLTATVEQQESEEDGVKSKLGAGNTVEWIAGDEIAVYDESGNVATLAAETSGTTSRFSGEDPAVYGTPKYGFYPASVAQGIDGSTITFTLPAEQAYAEKSFGQGVNVAAGKVEGNGIPFKNVCGVLHLQVKGRHQKIGRVTLTTKGDEALNGTFTVDASSSSAAVAAGEVTETRKSVSIICDPAIELVAGSPLDPNAGNLLQRDFYFVVPVGALANGFSVKFYDETGAVLPYDLATTASNIISRSKIKAMPLKTLAIDLSKNGTANSYMVPGPGFYCFKATVKGNGVSVNDAETTIDKSKMYRAAIIWESQNSASSSITILDQGNNVYCENGYVYFTTRYGEDDKSNEYHIGREPDYRIGNAVIAILTNIDPYLIKDNVLWSWHIWCTGDGVTDELHPGNIKIMDRNLGAVGTSGDGCCGLLYQWGRKDPMTGLATTSGTHAISSYNGDEYNAPSGGAREIPYVWEADTEPACPTIEWTINHPRLFAFPGEKPKNHWESEQSTNLWASEKTMYDPCPPGYKVPDETALRGFSVGTYVVGYGAEVDGYYWPATGTRGLGPEAGYDWRALAENAAQYWTNKAGDGAGGKVGYKLDLIEPDEDHKISYCVSANPVRCQKIN